MARENWNMASTQYMIILPGEVWVQYIGQIFIFVEDIFFMNGPMVVKKSRLSLNIEQLRNFLVSQKCDFFLSC